MLWNLVAVICVYEVRDRTRYYRYVGRGSDPNFSQKKVTEIKQTLIGKIALWNIKKGMKRGGW